MALLVHMGQENKTLKEFIDCLDPSNMKPFHEARQRLTRAVENIRDLNRQNHNLLDLSLKWIEGSVQMIAQLLSPEGASYGAKGEKKARMAQGEQGLTPRSTIEHQA